MPVATEYGPQQLFSISWLASRWGVSTYTIRRLLDAGNLRSVMIAARRMIPLAEVERAETLGVGIARKRNIEVKTQQGF